MLRWADGAEHGRRLATKQCAGQNNERRIDVQQTIGEPLHFHEWEDDPGKMIRRCLYPVRDWQIKSIELDDMTNTAMVEIDPAPTIQEKSFFPVAERLTGWRITIKGDVEDEPET
jgi:transcription antitermination factor NusA-like protein